MPLRSLGAQTVHHHCQAKLSPLFKSILLLFKLDFFFLPMDSNYCGVKMLEKNT